MLTSFHVLGHPQHHSDLESTGSDDELPVVSSPEGIQDVFNASGAPSAMCAAPIAVPKKAYPGLATFATPAPQFTQHPRAASAPSPPAILPSSPAAQFLSGFFSPPKTTLSLDPDAEGETVFGFRLGPEIGRGGFSVIRRATAEADGSVAAVKIVYGAAATTEKEEGIWQKLSHEHVLPLFSSHSTKRATYFITQFCPAGSLYDIMHSHEHTGGLPHDDAGMMFRQVVRGLRYLHEQAHVIHGDMKLENILVDECGVCKIADFGLAREMCADDSASSSEDSDADLHATELQRRKTMPGLSHHLSLMRPPRPRTARQLTGAAKASDYAHVQAGSLPYASPELLMPVTRRRRNGNTSPAQDIWALGVMLYMLLSGRFPFADAYDQRVRAKIVAGIYTPPPGIGAAAAAVLAGCLSVDMRERWTVRRVDEAAWGVGWGEVDVPEPEDDAGPPSSRTRSQSRQRPGGGPIRTRSHSRDARALPVDMGALSFDDGSRGRGRIRTTPYPQLSRSRSPSLPITPVDEVDVTPFGLRSGSRRRPLSLDRLSSLQEEEHK